MRAGCSHPNRFLVTLEDNVVDCKRKFFHAKDEEVRRQWITLSKPVGRLKGRQFVSIPKGREC